VQVNLPLASEHERFIRRTLLSLADTFVDVFGTSEARRDSSAQPGVPDRFLLGRAALYSVLARFDEAEQLYRRFDLESAGTGGTTYDALRTQLEFIEQLSRHAERMGDTSVLERFRPAIARTIASCVVGTDGLISIEGRTPVEIQALYYNALRILVRLDPQGNWSNRSQAVRHAISRRYDELVRGSDGAVTPAALYLVGLSGVISADHHNDLVTGAQQAEIIEAGRQALAGATAEDTASLAIFAGLYANARLALPAGDAEREEVSFDEMRSLINPILDGVLRGGTFSSGDWGGGVSVPLAIAELCRVFDLFSKPRLPGLDDPERAFRGAIRQFDIRSIKGLGGAA